MGYYTIHVIRIINKYNTESNLEKLWEALINISGYTFRKYGSALRDTNQFGSKWYECESDMTKISKLFPKFEIEIQGKGEEGDEWKLIYGDCWDSISNTFSEPDNNSDFCEETESNNCSYEEEKEDFDD